MDEQPEPRETPRPRRLDRRQLTAAIAGGAVVLLVVVLLVVGLANRGVGTAIDDSLDAGRRVPAPALDLTVLSAGSGREVGPAGSTLRLSDLRGKPVLVNFWASWCVPCQDEAPVMESLSRRVGDRAVILGLDTEDVTEDALAFMRRYKMTYPSVRDGTDASKRSWEVTGVPETFLIDRQGRIALHISGPISASQEDQVAQRLRELQ